MRQVPRTVAAPTLLVIGKGSDGQLGRGGKLVTNALDGKDVNAVDIVGLLVQVRAVSVGSGCAVGEGGQELAGKYILYFRNGDGGWKVERDIWNFDA